MSDFSEKKGIEDGLEDNKEEGGLKLEKEEKKDEIELKETGRVTERLQMFDFPD